MGRRRLWRASPFRPHRRVFARLSFAGISHRLFKRTTEIDAFCQNADDPCFFLQHPIGHRHSMALWFCGIETRLNDGILSLYSRRNSQKPDRRILYKKCKRSRFMSIKLQFQQMKMAYNINVKTPEDFHALQTIAFAKAWEFVTNYFKSLGEPLPKQQHGSPSYTCISTDKGDEVRSDADFRSFLEKGIDTFQIRFKVASHPSVPFV